MQSCFVKEKFELCLNIENLDEIVRDAVDIQLEKLEQKGTAIKVFREPANDFPSFMKLDKYRVSQILINLISNAVNLTNDGFIVIKITWTP